MVEKWIHINVSRGDPWVLPIWNSVNNAIKKGTVKEIPKKLSEQAIYITVRLNMLPRIWSRIEKEVIKLIAALGSRTEKHEFSSKKEGCAFTIDDDLQYWLLIDIDSLLFELNSLCELMTHFFKKLHSLSGVAMPEKGAVPSIKRVLKKAGQDSLWFENLCKHRNFFIHNAAPYIAVDISPTIKNKDVLVMKENLRDFTDNDKFIRLSQIEEIMKGFVASKPIIQKYLQNLFCTSLQLKRTS